MQFFLDTANLEDIKKYASWGIVDGVTTNPSLIAKEGKGVSLEKHIKEIVKIVNGPISTEVIATDVEGMVKEAKQYAKWHRNIYIKIPATPDGLQALKALTREGIKTNCTLVFSLAQAIMAAKAGAGFVSPFVGRLDDISEDGMALIADIVQAFKHYEYKTKVLVASVRNPRHVMESALIGADIVTMPPEIFDDLIKHPLTDKGMKKFLDDWKKSGAKS